MGARYRGKNKYWKVWNVRSREQVSLSLVRYQTSGEIRGEIRRINELIVNVNVFITSQLLKIQDYLKIESYNQELNEKIAEVIQRDRADHPFAHFFLVNYYESVYAEEAKSEILKIKQMRIQIPLREYSGFFCESFTDCDEFIACINLHKDFNSGNGWGRYERMLKGCNPLINITKNGEIEDNEILEKLVSLKGRLEDALPETVLREAEKKNKEKEKKLRDAKAVESKLEKQASKQRQKAAAAAHFGKTRTLAKGVRKLILDQVHILPICPYCGEALGDEPHADHIYPVSHGGLSTTENMVFICSTCNNCMATIKNPGNDN